MANEQRTKGTEGEPRAGSQAPDTDFGEHELGAHQGNFVGIDRGVAPDGHNDVSFGRTSWETIAGGSTEAGGTTRGLSGDADEGLGDGRTGATEDGIPSDETTPNSIPGEELPRLQDKSG